VGIKSLQTSRYLISIIHHMGVVQAPILYLSITLALARLSS
jgi:hypothetical protein